MKSGKACQETWNLRSTVPAVRTPPPAADATMRRHSRRLEVM